MENQLTERTMRGVGEQIQGESAEVERIEETADN